MAVGTKVQEVNTKRKGTIVHGHGARESVGIMQSWFNQPYQIEHSHQHHNQYAEVSWDADGAVEAAYAGQAGYYQYGGQKLVPLSNLTALPE